MLNWLSRKYWPGSLWAGIILMLTGLPGDYFPQMVSFRDWLSPDKLLHFIIFGVFTFLLLWGYRTQYLQAQKRFPMVRNVLITGFIYSGLTELMQVYVFTGRHGSIYDLLANVIGCLIGVAVFKFVIGKINRKNSSFI